MNDPGSGAGTEPEFVETWPKVGESPSSSSENTNVDGTEAQDGAVDKLIVTRLFPEPSVLVPSVKHPAVGAVAMQYSPVTVGSHVMRPTPKPLPRLTVDPRF